MNDEIKEILNKLQYGFCSQLTYEKLLDYITNLQQKVEQYESPDDLTLFYMWLDEKAKDKMKQLQEENEVLENEKDIFYKVSQERLNKWLSLNEENNKLVEIIKDYKSRNEKALEYLEEPNRDNFDYSKVRLIEILRGDKE